MIYVFYELKVVVIVVVADGLFAIFAGDVFDVTCSINHSTAICMKLMTSFSPCFTTIANVDVVF